VVVPSAAGATDFSVLQNELKGRSTKIVMVAFDLMYLNGYDLRKLPLFDRKALLKKIINGTDIQFSDSFEVDGAEMYKHACKTGLEALSPKSAIAGMRLVGAMTGLKRPAPSGRRCRLRASL
jgi:bifunctional non-homologous end joining protein LigD